MERKSKSSQPLCRSGCGFYGNPGTGGYCSLCYKTHLKESMQQSFEHVAAVGNIQSNAEMNSTKSSADTPMEISGDAIDLTVQPLIKLEVSDDKIITEQVEENIEEANNKDENGKKKNNRCDSCRKRLGLTVFRCRCGGQYCAVHRYSDKHDCTFNYREHGAQEIKRNNPVVIGEKIKKI